MICEYVYVRAGDLLDQKGELIGYLGARFKDNSEPSSVGIRN